MSQHSDIRKVIDLLAESEGGTRPFDGIDVYYLLEFAKAYARLGWAVQEQVETLMNDPGEWPNLNSNAVKEIQYGLAQYSSEISEACQEYFEELQRNGDEN